jgi:hypothetical protein
MKRIELPCYKIVVEMDDERLGGTITSELKDKENEGCIFNYAMDGLEAMILAHACAGIDITTPAYLEGIETAVDACANHLEDV